MKIRYLFIFLLGIQLVLAQSTQIQIVVVNSYSIEPLEGAAILNLQNNESYSTDSTGVVSILDLEPSVYSFEISAENYETQTLFEIEIVPNANVYEEIYLEPIQSLNEVVVQAQTFAKTTESPTSLRSMTSEEITRNPGANRDISKVVQSLPGVTSTNSFRNDLLIRGGGPNENRFYIDDIETPVINHFATQGASGGPRGMINVNFLKEVQFYSSAFPSNRGNALSSVFEFEMKNPSKDPFHFKSVIGLDDMSFSSEGTLGKNQDFNYLVSVNRSNLQLLFKALDLPFLPSYTDMNIKLEKKFKNGDKLYLLSVWAIDQFKLNLDVEKTEENIAILDRLPVAPQNNYTLGAVYQKNTQNGNWKFIASKNFLHNTAVKHFKNIETPENLLLNYRSNESDERLRIERNMRLGEYKLYWGGGLNFSHYYNSTFNRYVLRDQVFDSNYWTSLDFSSYYGFVNVQNSYFNNRLKASLGVRIDGADYNGELNKPLEQFSPRLALAYQFANRWFVNFSAGKFFQLPQYTAMGFRDLDNALVNKENVDYIENTHWVLGLEYNTKKRLKFTAEGFYKKYNHYPFSIEKGINLANLGGDFGVVGVEPLLSNGFGRTYGLELLAQQRTSTDIYGILAYTLSWSEFNNAQGEYLPSAWDARHILSVTAGKKLNKGWDLGFRFRMQSALPETPYDLYNSSFVRIWDVNNGPLVNYDLLNTQRGVLANQLDLRVQKKWFYKKWSISLYADIINVYGGSLGNDLPIVNLERDAEGNPIIMNPEAPFEEQQYKLITSEPDRPTPLPYMGLIIEF